MSKKNIEIKELHALSPEGRREQVLRQKLAMNGMNIFSAKMASASEKKQLRRSLARLLTLTSQLSKGGVK
jgi:ribosomal protein L29